MSRPKRLKITSEIPSAVGKAVRKPKVSKGKYSLSSLPAELQLGILHHLPRTSLPTICLLNKHWHSVGTDELLQRLLPIPPHKTDAHGINLGEERLKRAIRHLIDTNNVDALQRLLDFRPKHPYFRPTTTSLLRPEPASLRMRVTKDEEERFCLVSHLGISFCAMKAAMEAAFKYNDISCMQLLIDHGLANYGWLLDKAVDDSFCAGVCHYDWLARPLPGLDSRGGHNPVLNWLLAYPPRHVVQAMLVMWGRLPLHPRLQPLCDWRSPIGSLSRDNMLIVAAGRGHPASRQTINELCMMVEILTDDDSGGVIPEARQPLSRALRIAWGISSMWPGTPPLVAEYLQGICTWEDKSSRSGGRRSNNTDNPPPLPAPPLIMPPQDPVLHRLIDLKTYEEMLDAGNWLELRHAELDHPTLKWLVSTEFLADEEAARRMRCFKRLLRRLSSAAGFTYSLLHAAATFRRWRCVEVVLGALRGRWVSGFEFSGNPEPTLSCAILDAVRGEPGCADGRIIRKLLQTDARDLEDLKCVGVYENMPNDSPFRGGWFGWEPFRLAFAEWQPDREQRETPACMEMRDAILENLSISDQDALNFLVGEPSKALYRACTRRLRKRLADKRKRGKGAGRGSRLGKSSCRRTTTSSSINSGGHT